MLQIIYVHFKSADFFVIPKAPVSSKFFDVIIIITYSSVYWNYQYK